ncbi:MAG TPA: XRE family transcriptional regulator [Pseudonocardiaceae bacterium]|nr:XRE family transcriptional regulator [Pseudonocardiaceae bacterium]
MGWNEVEADMDAHGRATGRDVDADREHARRVVNAYILGYRLSQLRDEVGMTQTQLAERMGISQPRVSQMEKGDVGQLEIDTVRRYIAALGGKLKIVADFEDHAVTVSNPERDRTEIYACRG